MSIYGSVYVDQVEACAPPTSISINMCPSVIAVAAAYRLWSIPVRTALTRGATLVAPQKSRSDRRSLRRPSVRLYVAVLLPEQGVLSCKYLPADIANRAAVLRPRYRWASRRFFRPCCLFNTWTMASGIVVLHKSSRSHSFGGPSSASARSARHTIHRCLDRLGRCLPFKSCRAFKIGKVVLDGGISPKLFDGQPSSRFCVKVCTFHLSL